MRKTEEHEKAHRLKQYRWLLVWIVVALVVNVFVYFTMGKNEAVDFLGGYVTELSLSIDNVFVFLMIFMGFKLDEKAQHRVLGWGIIGAIVLRFLFVFFGLALVNRFEWILYVFGAILIFSGSKMFRGEEEEKDPHDSKVIRIMSKMVPMTTYFQDDRFFVVDKGKRLATPLLGVLALIETSDIIFAVDSVPAVISITRNLFIVYVSNILAILCLRQLYFVIEHMQEKFRYVRYGVALILIFTGIKMLLGIWQIHVSTVVSILVIVGLLVASIAMSIVLSEKKEADIRKEAERYGYDSEQADDQ